MSVKSRVMLAKNAGAESEATSGKKRKIQQILLMMAGKRAADSCCRRTGEQDKQGIKRHEERNDISSKEKAEDA